ncbi:hypothetical protein AvCA_05810 [Azotobacter vinelandii CA]|uniref:Uncharacterized protein n=2 Tax=Azotobacter vinelandii TaxID=354 RepID=C1DKH1_AZOVD|nr:hypothetical protein Avin_05810 [Azotobacter vinelandii DJ]AGK15564.1 hypothetical protein AvCA_05810 [Azotobacter vinelandii CA]AGK19406.1 hypothetical protein AvCA6_05810 [Azotobacter vinelandii CA6]
MSWLGYPCSLGPGGEDFPTASPRRPRAARLVRAAMSFYDLRVRLCGLVRRGKGDS